MVRAPGAPQDEGEFPMHIIVKARDDAITIKLDDGRIYRVTLRDGEAHVPDHVGRFMIEHGYVAQGPEPNPKPRWERVAGGGHGALIPMFSRWCEEFTSQSDLEKTK
jgi:hypothetical protein